MNYNHQFPALDANCSPGGDGIDKLGYSIGNRTTLVQGQLDEAQGLYPLDHPLHTAIDWNGNGVVDPGPVRWSGTFSDNCTLTTATDFDDYSALAFPRVHRLAGVLRLRPTTAAPAHRHPASGIRHPASKEYPMRATVFVLLLAGWIEGSWAQWTFSLNPAQTTAGGLVNMR